MQSHEHCNGDRSTSNERGGKVLVLLSVCLPMLLGLVGLVLDGSLLMVTSRDLQSLADAGATRAAIAFSDPNVADDPMQSVIAAIQHDADFGNFQIDVSSPPTSGPYIGRTNYVEVNLTQSVPTNLHPFVGGEATQSVRSRAVAGLEVSTESAAIVVLDPDPSPVTISGLTGGLLTVTLPSIQLGGLEVLGAGALEVDGAVHVNTEWGGVDVDGNPAGEEPPLGGLRHAISCTPLVSLTKMKAREIRVTGGVGNPNNYGHVDGGEPNPLSANRLPVADPYESLPVPTVSSDPTNVSSVEHGGVDVVSLPLIGPTTRLEPGVYEWINVISGRVVFEPGVYIVRGVNPLTGIAVALTAGTIDAEGVMFYVTDSGTFSPWTGFPDISDSSDSPPPNHLSSLLPSVVINTALPGSKIHGLDDPGSPYDGLLVFQRRQSRNPIALVASDLLLLGSDFSGSIYSKWGQVLFVGQGTYDLTFACGTLRIVNVLDCNLTPSKPLSPASDVYLVE
ncbi:pilus assembly protein TadG-related protein [Thalassoroseus pseudoceratinae]|uniref:pilus assembly protein TadG-related protein n=1 Tax=Thalassoroseus pseudoceratinae TaxID=2713176 RepID=UPI0014234E60|nr:pilus assembly protein TadG-related protein [Thalassoroseus pseudoceratinae]